MQPFTSPITVSSAKGQGRSLFSPAGDSSNKIWKPT